MTPSADEQITGISVKAASDIEIDHEQLDKSIADFVENNPGYYQEAFHKVHAATTSLPNTFNWVAAILGPIWGGFRGVWAFSGDSLFWK